MNFFWKNTPLRRSGVGFENCLAVENLGQKGANYGDCAAVGSKR